MPVISVLGGLRQKNFYKLEASLGYNVNLIFKKEAENCILEQQIYVYNFNNIDKMCSWL